MGRLETILEARALVERVGVVEDGNHYAEEEFIPGVREEVGPVRLRMRGYDTNRLCGVCIAGACIVADGGDGLFVWSDLATVAARDVLADMSEDLDEWEDRELSGAIDRFGKPYVLAVLDEMAARERQEVPA